MHYTRQGILSIMYNIMETRFEFDEGVYYFKNIILEGIYRHTYILIYKLYKRVR